MAGQRVLVVDDDAQMRELNRLVLESTGRFTVVGEASDGGSALVMASRLQPDLVLLDLVMPGVGGFDVIADLRKTVPNSRIVVLSMLDEERHARRAMALGADSFIDKSKQTSSFIRLVENDFAPAP